MRLAASVPGGIVGSRLLSCVPSHQRKSAPRLAPIEIAATDFHMHHPVLSLSRTGGEMSTPTVRLKRRHHQPLTRRFGEECHLRGPQSTGVRLPTSTSTRSAVSACWFPLVAPCIK